MTTQEQEHYAFHTASFAIRVALVSQLQKWMEKTNQPLHGAKKPIQAVLWGVHVKLTASEDGLLIDGKTPLQWLEKIPEKAAMEALQSYNFQNSPHCTWAQAWRGYQLRYSKTTLNAL